jgi:hypothetical protein
VQRTANNDAMTMTFNPYDVVPKDTSYWCAHQDDTSLVLGSLL